ncbi:perlucin-like protein [Macrobrachium nipponense]|uniref:perlucin-like protein n=1 Tax=Macrobrachium nipponense TaxID=159736 RepID=UPI0030C843EF
MGMTNIALFIILLIPQGYANNQTQDEIQVQYICPPNFLRLGQSCYYFSRSMANWHNAHFACRDRGGQLATLESQWEDNTIKSYLNRTEFARLNRWIGGIYNWPKQQWTWGSTAEEMPYQGFHNSEMSESYRWHCVFMSPVFSYQWNHTLCTDAMHYICEMPQSRILDLTGIV